ncbi:unnamed protein product, partial [Phaeothamnion confervicola]
MGPEAGAGNTWVEPTLALPQGDADVLTPEQIKSWRENGFALVNGVWPTAVLDDCMAAAKSCGLCAPPCTSGGDFGSAGGKMEFPTVHAEINAVTLHPRILRATSQLLDTSDIRLTQSDIWPKWGREKREPCSKFDNLEQRIHMDFPNHTLTHPSAWDAPDAVEVILYFHDVEEAEG